MSKAEPVLSKAALVTAAILATFSQTDAARAFSPECAAHDLRLVSTIEENGNAGTIPSHRLSAAYISLLEARKECRAGKTADALRAYRSITVTSAEAAAQPVR